MIIVALSEVSVRLWRRCAVYKGEDEKMDFIQGKRYGCE